jgi:hypothetical protein
MKLDGNEELLLVLGKLKILTCANLTGPDEMLIRNDSNKGSIFIVTSQSNYFLEHSR